MAPAEMAEKGYDQRFREALPRLRAALKSLPRGAQQSWNEHIIHTTVNMSQDLKKAMHSEQVEELMFKEVFAATAKRGKNTIAAFNELIPMWELKRGKMRMPPRPRSNSRPLMLAKPLPPRPHRK